MTVLYLFAAIGFCISLYAYIIEIKIKRDPSYKPACDLSDLISCSKPMTSRYANLFYFSNAFLGIIFYATIALLTYLQATTLLLVAAIVACMFSVILAYILYFKIKSLCLLCTALYLVNVLILVIILVK